MSLDSHTFGQVNFFDIEMQQRDDIRESFGNIAENLGNCKVELKKNYLAS